MIAFREVPVLPKELGNHGKQSLSYVVG